MADKVNTDNASHWVSISILLIFYNFFWLDRNRIHCIESTKEAVLLAAQIMKGVMWKQFSSEKFPLSFSVKEPWLIWLFSERKIERAATGIDIPTACPPLSFSPNRFSSNRPKYPSVSEYFFPEEWAQSLALTKFENKAYHSFPRKVDFGIMRSFSALFLIS